MGAQLAIARRLGFQETTAFVCIFRTQWRIEPCVSGQHLTSINQAGLTDGNTGLLAVVIFGPAAHHVSKSCAATGEKGTVSLS